MSDTNSIPEYTDLVNDALNTKTEPESIEFKVKDERISYACEGAPYEFDALKECSDIYTDIKYVTMKDTHGRTIYRFENKGIRPLVIVVFKNCETRLISVNQQVLSLRTFLKIQEMNHIDADKPLTKTEGIDLRMIDGNEPVLNSGIVKAFSSENKQIYVFENTTVPLMMMAISVLTEHFGVF